MHGNLVSYRYTDGRLRPHPDYIVTVGASTVKELLAAKAPIEIVEGHELVGLKKKRAPKPDPEPETAPENDEGDGWPAGYSFTRRGAYLAVFDPTGEPILSDSPSGKFRGEDAAQEAAWLHKGGKP